MPTIRVITERAEALAFIQTQGAVDGALFVFVYEYMMGHLQQRRGGSVLGAVDEFLAVARIGSPEPGF